MANLIDFLRQHPDAVLVAWAVFAGTVWRRRRGAARHGTADTIRRSSGAPPSRPGPGPTKPPAPTPAPPARPPQSARSAPAAVVLDAPAPVPPKDAPGHGQVAAGPPDDDVTMVVKRPRSFSGKAFVIDGDTIGVRGTKIRLAGIDAPELDRPYGRKAKWAMVDICKGHEITVELNGEASHDRLVGTCRLPDGTDIAAELVRRGLALDVPFYSNGRYRRFEPEGVRRKLHDPAAGWRYRRA